MKKDLENTISQTDFYLSAFYLTNNFELLKIIRDNPRRLIFVFKDCAKRQRLTEDFLMSKTKVEPNEFISNIKKLKRLIYSDF